VLRDEVLAVRRETRRLLCALVFSAIPLSSEGFRDEHRRDVILALERSRGVHVIDATTLENSGLFVAGNVDRSVGASPDGRTLFVEQADASGSCCALYALDIETRSICKLGGSLTWVVTPDCRFLFTQYGNSGIEVFNARTLARMPRVAMLGGPYAFYASPDCRWLFGISLFRGASLDLFEIERRERVRRFPFTETKILRGAWLKDQFYCFAHDGNLGRLWKVSPETYTVGQPVTVTLDALASSEKPVWLEVVALGDRLVVFEPFGTKLDRRRSRRYRSNSAGLPGGLFILDPSNGDLLAHLAPSVFFSRLVASTDGQWVYGIDSGGPDWTGPVRLLKIDSRTGKAVTERLLEPGVWSIAFAKIPVRLLPRDRVLVNLCNDGLL